MFYNLSNTAMAPAPVRVRLDDHTQMMAIRGMTTAEPSITPPRQEKVPPQHDASSGDSFKREAEAHVLAVRTTLSKMLESTGHQIMKSRDAQKYFGLDGNRSWQLFKLLSGEDLLALAQYVPKPASMARILSAARERGVVEPLINAAKDAFEKFEQFAETHAADRTRFESMVTSLAQGDDAQQADIQHRKAIFQGHSHLLGLELDAMYLLYIVGRSPTSPNHHSNVLATYLLGLTRLRPDADPVIFGSIDTNTPPRETMDPEGLKQYGAPILTRFSTSALPRLKIVDEGSGLTRTLLAGDSVGLMNRVDIASSQVIRDIGRADDGTLMTMTFAPTMFRPTRQLYIDVLIDRTLFARADNATLKLFAHVTPETMPEKRENPSCEMPCRERVEYIPAGRDARILEVPRRSELIAYCCDHQHWQPENFDVYRVHLEYPLIDTLVRIAITCEQLKQMPSA